MKVSSKTNIVEPKSESSFQTAIRIRTKSIRLTRNESEQTNCVLTKRATFQFDPLQVVAVDVLDRYRYVDAIAVNKQRQIVQRLWLEKEIH